MMAPTDTGRVRVATREDAPAIARIHVDTWQSAHRGIVPKSYLERLSYEGRCEQWARTMNRQDGSFVLLVEGSTGLVGFASAGPSSDQELEPSGLLTALYVLARDQGRGYGRLLIDGVARRLLSGGISSMAVWVFKQNPACAFYERLGGEWLREGIIELDGTKLIKVAYGFHDLRKVTQ
jgi:GNAT superfamily N-acetyltransferase